MEAEIIEYYRMCAIFTKVDPFIKTLVSVDVDKLFDIRKLDQKIIEGAKEQNSHFMAVKTMRTLGLGPLDFI
jgi:hypothetical protein